MTRLYVANVSTKADTSELKELLSDCGKLKHIDIKDGSGYIEFETPDEAEEAIKKFNGYEFQGKSLVVEPARRVFPRGGFKGRKFPPGVRDRRRSNSRSSSRSRSRSRNRKKRSHYRSRSRSNSRSVSRSSRSRSKSRDRNHKRKSKRSRSRS